MRPWRRQSQSMASYKSFSFAPAMPSTWPSDELAVPVRNPRGRRAWKTARSPGRRPWPRRGHAPARDRVDQLFEPEAAQRPEHGGDVAVGQAADDLEVDPERHLGRQAA